ncbi:MAG: 16S rRNA (guanine(527)-N(7))-methyltransferase RsmG, partial [Phycisphaerales bacterium]|nr:16S rRNA (guanine(527)-N(7))-methyltransferase RsmG [Phycisphaerales bacterium]
MSKDLNIPQSFIEEVASLGIEFDAGDVDALASYLHLLYEKNQVMNLTAVKSIEDAWERHLYDSLTLLPILSELQCEHVIDVGSGGGLPGIPLAITLPEMTFVLVETTKKKALFLHEVV